MINLPPRPTKLQEYNCSTIVDVPKGFGSSEVLAGFIGKISNLCLANDKMEFSAISTSGFDKMEFIRNLSISHN